MNNVSGPQLLSSGNKEKFWKLRYRNDGGRGKMHPKDGI
jgi:hypothetical protein